MSFHPYLMFGGNCRDAFSRYHEIFGGQLDVLSMKDMPAGEPVPAGQEDLVMHAALTLGDDVLMGSDDPTAEDFRVQGMQVNYTVGDVDEAKRVFEALVDGGEVTLPIGPTFWSPMFGMCVDRFGTPWMVGAEPPEERST
jgi:PhnB protein